MDTRSADKLLEVEADYSMHVIMARTVPIPSHTVLYATAHSVYILALIQTSLEAQHGFKHIILPRVSTFDHIETQKLGNQL